VTPPDLDRFVQDVSRQYAALVADGRWFSPLRDALDAFVDKVEARVTGAIRLRLLKGACRVVGPESPGQRDDQAPAVGGEGEGFRPVASDRRRDAVGRSVVRSSMPDSLQYVSNVTGRGPLDG